MITTRDPRKLLPLYGLITAAFLLCFTPTAVFAQRGGHAPMRGGGGGGMHGGMGGGGRSMPSHVPASRPSINGGAQRSPSRTAPSRPSNTTDRGGNLKGNAGGDRNTNVKGGDRNTNIKGGNKTNINSGNTNVNINVNNSHNTTVRRNTNVHYNRPPYRYGGHAYYCYHPYYYHPYHPFYWGPVWHPWGFFVATMATTAIIVSVENQQYHYDQGVFYAPSSGGYTVVAAPVGATVTTLPSNAQTVQVNETTNNYYYGGTYYEKDAKGYTVVPPTAGTVVEDLPEGGKEVKVGDQTYVQVGETYYSPVQKDGKDMYEVVDVQSEADKN